MTLGLGNLLSVSNRIAEFQNPATRSPSSQQHITIRSLPSISSVPLKHENIFSNPPPPASRREKFEYSVGTIAKSYGQSPPSQSAKPRKFLESQRDETKKYLGVARQKLLTQGQQEAFSSGGFYTRLNETTLAFLRTSFGKLFRQTFKRRVCTVVLGTPYGDLSPIVDSVNALTALALASLTEDNYGKVANDVPLLIRAFVSVISSVEAFVDKLPAHWTDVEFEDSDRKVEEVEMVIGSLKEGLKEMLAAFGKYAAELGMEEGEIRGAKRVAGLEADE